MKCTNCGANIGDGAGECPFCGSAINRELSFNESDYSEVMTTQTAMNPLLDKEYNFSGNDLLLKGRWGVNVDVQVGEDRLYFQTFPAKKNVYPAIMLEDIMAIEERFHMRKANIAIGLFGLLLGFAGGTVGFLLPVLILLLYRERKIIIYLRNGNKMTIYSGDKALVNQFVEDMKSITMIR